jgi:hypothetical protein
MDPITLIVTALVAGAALGAQDTMSAMVKDAYTGLKNLVSKRLGGGPGAELVPQGMSRTQKPGSRHSWQSIRDDRKNQVWPAACTDGDAGPALHRAC